MIQRTEESVSVMLTFCYGDPGMRRIFLAMLPIRLIWFNVSAAEVFRIYLFLVVYVHIFKRNSVDRCVYLNKSSCRVVFVFY